MICVKSDDSLRGRATTGPGDEGVRDRRRRMGKKEGALYHFAIGIMSGWYAALWAVCVYERLAIIENRLR